MYDFTGDDERRMEVIDSGDICFRLYITVAEGTRKSRAILRIEYYCLTE